jgi:ABC-type Na+ efflux pump permease subunit
MGAILARWSFVAAGVLAGIVLVTLYHAGVWTKADTRLAIFTVLAAEIVVVMLVALNMSATAVSREREDGTLDLILTTPIQPGPYLAGKLRGLIQFLLPLMIVPVLTTFVASLYVTAGGFGRQPVWFDEAAAGSPGTVSVPLILPEGVVTLPLVLVPFVALCAMFGLHWSIRSKGTIGSVIAAVLAAGGLAAVLFVCAYPAGQQLPLVGAALSAMSPINQLWAIVYPFNAIPESLEEDVVAGRIALAVGAIIGAVAYVLVVYGMHANNKRTFMMTVRKLAGTN